MNERGEMNGNILCGKIKGYNNSIPAIMCEVGRYSAS